MIIKILSTSRDMVGDIATIRAEIHEPHAGYTRVKDTIEVEITGGENGSAKVCHGSGVIISLRAT